MNSRGMILAVAASALTVIPLSPAAASSTFAAPYTGPQFFTISTCPNSGGNCSSSADPDSGTVTAAANTSLSVAGDNQSEAAAGFEARGVQPPRAPGVRLFADIYISSLQISGPTGHNTFAEVELVVHQGDSPGQYAWAWYPTNPDCTYQPGTTCHIEVSTFGLQPGPFDLGAQALAHAEDNGCINHCQSVSISATILDLGTKPA